MIAKLTYYDPPCGTDCCSRQYWLQVSNTERKVCSNFAAWLRKHLEQEDEDAQMAIDARRLWEEIPSPCWMMWFLLVLASGEARDEALSAGVRQLARELDMSLSSSTLDPEKCRLVREVFPWERVEALLAEEP